MNTKLQENKNLHQFIKCIIGKNYSEANKYLQRVVETKVGSRIRKVSNTKLFK